MYMYAAPMPSDRVWDAPVLDTQTVDEVLSDDRPHAWHFANELCFCGAPSVLKNRPASISSTIPLR